MKFSIIIPVYNVRTYLQDCISSVINQTFDDYEMILVDDGSTDGSGELCENIATRYAEKNIRIIHKENGGLDSARKAGIASAQGVYLIFLDSDDWMAKNQLEIISQKINSISTEADIIQTAYTVVYPDGKMRRVSSFEKVFEGKKIITGAEFLFNEIMNGISLNSVWSKIYKRDFLIRANIPVLPKYSCEDMETLVMCAAIGCKFSYIDENMVMFRSGREGSITTLMSSQYIMGYVDTVQRIIKKMMASSIEHREELCSRFAELCLEQYQCIDSLPKNQRGALYTYISQQKNILDLATGGLATQYRILGYKLGNKVIRGWLILYKVYDAIIGRKMRR